MTRFHFIFATSALVLTLSFVVQGGESAYSLARTSLALAKAKEVADHARRLFDHKHHPTSSAGQGLKLRIESEMEIVARGPAFEVRCRATVASKQRISAETCEVGLLTAASCLSKPDGKGYPQWAHTISAPFGELTPGEKDLQVPETPSAGAPGWIFFRVSCGLVAGVDFLKIATRPARSGGSVFIGTDQKKWEPTAVEGFLDSSDVRSERKVRTMQALPVNGVGAPIWSSDGIVGVSSGMGGPHQTSFATEGLDWIKRVLRERYGAPHPAEEKVEKKESTETAGQPRKTFKQIIDEVAGNHVESEVVPERTKEVKPELEAKVETGKHSKTDSPEDHLPEARASKDRVRERSFEEPNGEALRSIGSRISRPRPRPEIQEKEEENDAEEESLSEELDSQPDDTLDEFPNLKIDADPLSPSHKTLFGKSVNGDFVTLRVNKKSGKLVGDVDGSVKLSRATETDLYHFYGKNLSHFDEAGLAVAKRFRAYYEAKYRKSEAGIEESEPEAEKSPGRTARAEEDSSGGRDSDRSSGLTGGPVIPAVPRPWSSGASAVPANPPTQVQDPSVSFPSGTNGRITQPTIPPAVSSVVPGSASAHGSGVPSTSPSGVTPTVGSPAASDFVCVKVGNGFSPAFRRTRKTLGRGPFPGHAGSSSKQDCEAAIGAAKNGIVCSYTLLGYKPTHWSGSTPYRADEGFWGSSIQDLDACLLTSKYSTRDGVCYWGGSNWVISPIDGSNSTRPGGQTLKACLQNLWKGHWPPPETAVATPRPSTQANIAPTLPTIIPTPAVTQPPAVHRIAQPPAHVDSAAMYSRLCSQCHTAQPGKRARGPEFASWLLDPEKLHASLSSSDPKTKAYAEEWADRLRSMLVDSQSMPPAGSKQAELAESDAELAKLKQYLSVKQDHASVSLPPTVNATYTPSAVSSTPATLASNAVQLLDAKSLQNYRALLPTVQDTSLMEIFRDPNTLFYDDKAMPKGYQDPWGIVHGVRPPIDFTRLSPDAGMPTPPYAELGNYRDPNDGRIKTGAQLKIFSHGAGIDPKSSVRSFYFLSLPKDGANRLKQIQLSSETIHDGNHSPLWKWKFPTGTISGEVLYATDSRGYGHVLEVRTRTKDSENGIWKPDIFVATPTKKHLLDRLAQIRATRSDLSGEIDTVATQLASAPLRSLSLGHSGYQVTSIDSQGATQDLPKMSEALTTEILKTPFQSALGAVWHSEGNLNAFAPTTSQAFGLVPQYTKRGALPVSRESCNRCHQLTNTPISDLYPDRRQIGNLLRNTTDAYGNLPGNDGNMRWHPFEPSKMWLFGNDRIDDNREINRALLPILQVRR